MPRPFVAGSIQRGTCRRMAVGDLPVEARQDLLCLADSQVRRGVGPGDPGPSPKSAKTYGKDPLRTSIWEAQEPKGAQSGVVPRHIAHNFGAHVAVGAMFAEEQAYFAQ
jgi:hypothetical protein